MSVRAWIRSPITLNCLALLVSVGILACAPGEPPAPTGQSAGPSAGGTAVLGSITDVDSWNEYVSRQSFAGSLLRRIYLRLAEDPGDGRQHPDGFRPLLAESWEPSDDGRALTFRLREARWSDGAPITADDVRFSWEAQTSPDVPWIAATSKARITNVRVLDQRRVRFEFDAPYPHQLADAVEGGILPRHVFSQVPFADWATHDWSQTRVASGPFVLDEHLPGQEIRLARNPYYFGDGPYLDRVVVRVVPDIGSLVTQLRTGDLDFVDGITPRDAASLGADPQIRVIDYDYPGYDYIGWNGSRPPFDDPELRRAMTLAIDRQALVDDLLYGYGQISTGPVLSFWWAGDPGLGAWRYDPDEARRILAAHGYRTSQGKELPASAGRALEVELMTNLGNRLREEMLVKIQAQLARIGVQAHVRPVEMRTLRQRAAAGEYDGYLGGWVYSVKDLRSIFDSASVVPHGANVVFFGLGRAPWRQRRVLRFGRGRYAVRSHRWRGTVRGDGTAPARSATPDPRGPALHLPLRAQAAGRAPREPPRSDDRRTVRSAGPARAVLAALSWP